MLEMVQHLPRSGAASLQNLKVQQQQLRKLAQQLA